jgi:adenosylhomocysteine nucleosidase
VSRLLVLTAMDLEGRALARELGLARRPSSPFPRFAGGRIEVVPVGLRASRVEARWLVDGAPALVVSAGTCGALSPVLGEPGALVVPREVLTLSGARLAVDPAGHARALAAAARAGLAAAVDPLLTADAIVESPEAKAALARETGAVAVDMESAAILAAAARRGVPAVVVRAVSDTAAQRVPRELGDLVDDEGRTRPGRAAALVLRRPALIGRALALQRGAAVALKAVARVLAEIAEGEA